MTKALRSIVALVCVSAAQSGTDWTEQVHAVRPVDVSANESRFLDAVELHMKRALDAVPHAGTQPEADAARPGIRQHLEDSLGFRRLPWPPDLQARTTGVVRRQGYRIEKIVYQSLPGTWVPAHLYLPERVDKPAPSIVFYNGHWFSDSKMRPDHQAFCINMARLGFIVLNFDAFGQGERGISTRDHRRAAGLLVGVSQQGWAEYETQCAIAYLLTRREVDPNRLGMTGASGGGYNTWMTAALDDRIKVLAPVVGTSEFYEQSAARRPRDWDPHDQCHYVPGLMRYANNHELIAAVAPRPVLIVSAAKDPSFPIAGVRQVVAYGRELYKAYGISEKFSFYLDSTAGHGYQQKKREAVYGWFLRWFMDRGDGSPFPEPPTQTEPYDAPELRCLPPGANEPAGPGMMAAVMRLAKQAPSAAIPDLQRILGPFPEIPPATAHLAPDTVQRLLIPVEPGLEEQAFLVRPTGDAKGVLLAIDDRGKEAVGDDPLVRRARERGWAILGVDPRGIGESATGKKTWIFACSLLAGENVVWLQASDILRAAAYIAPEFRSKPFAIYARGDDASLAASYALGSNRLAGVQWYVLRDGFLSLRQFVDRPESLPLSYTLWPDDSGKSKPLDREIPSIYFAFNALRYFDLPQLLAASPARGLIVNPIDGDWRRMTVAGARKLESAAPHVEIVSGDAPDGAIERWFAQN